MNETILYTVTVSFVAVIPCDSGVPMSPVFLQW
jgi:hypothetical protein